MVEGVVALPLGVTIVGIDDGAGGRWLLVFAHFARGQMSLAATSGGVHLVKGGANSKKCGAKINLPHLVRFIFLLRSGCSPSSSSLF